MHRIDIASRPLGSFFGVGFRSVECPRCHRAGLQITRSPTLVAHGLTFKLEEGEAKCEWLDVCGGGSKSKPKKS